jgi:arylsulfatase A-like enzyme
MRHLFILAALIVFSTSAPAAARPNVLLILADDLGWADLSPDPYDNPHVQTPHLEGLARGGMAFTNYYSPGAVCSPARAGILTGHNPARYGIHTAIGGTVEINERYDQPSWLDSAAPTLAKMLQTAGYRTAVIGKWHLGSAKGAPRPDTYGFDLARTTTSRNRERGWDGIPRVLLADAQVDASLDFIDETPAGTPWLLYLSLLVPHATLDMLGERPFSTLSMIVSGRRRRPHPMLVPWPSTTAP